MSKIVLLFLLLFISLFAETNSLIVGMSLTTEPTSTVTAVQDSNYTVPYTHERLPLNGSGYYSVEGTFSIDSLLENPALFVGSTIYPISISIDNKPIYQWGSGDKSNHLADYRSHCLRLWDFIKGAHSLRIDFWSNGETMALPVIELGDQIDLQNRATLTSLFNIHLLNGILISAVFIAVLFLSYFSKIFIF